MAAQYISIFTPIESSPTLSIVLPAFNPLSSWVTEVHLNLQKIKQHIPVIELIIVNDGSITFDETVVAHLSEYQPKVISYQINRGKGYALRRGVESAMGHYTIYTDVDFPYSIRSFLELYKELNHSDVVIGVRSSSYYDHVPKARVWISRIFRSIIRTFLRIPTDDTQCGLKGFNQKGKEVFLQTTIDRYLFDLEFVFLAARAQLKIKTVEVELRPEVQLSKMHWTVLMHEFGNFLKIFFRSFAR